MQNTVMTAGTARSAQPACIVIACGGDGRRMGGGKPTRELAGVPLVQRMAQWALAQTDCVALALRDRGQAPTMGLPVLLDSHSGIGPISALASAFGFAASNRRRHALMVGCDQPFLPADLLARLAAAIGDGNAAMPVNARREQPMASLWRVDTVRLENYIANGGQSLWRFASEIGAIRAEWAETEPNETYCSETYCGDPFCNINDPAGLASAEHRIRNARK